KMCIRDRLQGVAHLPALLMQLAVLAAGAVLFADLQQLRPVANGCCFAVSQQQGGLEAGKVEQ
ncbi:hypothetical protein ALP29_201370, partial [Pseudomonas syringae pv. avii]